MINLNELKIRRGNLMKKALHTTLSLDEIEEYNRINKTLADCHEKVNSNGCYPTTLTCVKLYSKATSTEMPYSSQL